MAKYFVRYSVVEGKSWKDDGGIITATITDIQTVKDAVLTDLLAGATLPIEIISIHPLDAGSGGGGGTAYSTPTQIILNTNTTHDVNANTVHSLDIAVLIGTAQIIVEDGVGGTTTANVSEGFTIKYGDSTTELLSRKISIVCPNTDSYIVITKMS